jgi:hypothetical protein
MASAACVDSVGALNATTGMEREAWLMVLEGTGEVSQTRFTKYGVFSQTLSRGRYCFSNPEKGKTGRRKTKRLGKKIRGFGRSNPTEFSARSCSV